MQDVKLIEVDTLTDVEANPNFIVKDRTEGKWYIGDATNTPPEIPTSQTPVYANYFMFI
jgi:hypothetical protein